MLDCVVLEMIKVVCQIENIRKLYQILPCKGLYEPLEHGAYDWDHHIMGLSTPNKNPKIHTIRRHTVSVYHCLFKWSFEK